MLILDRRNGESVLFFDSAGRPTRVTAQVKDHRVRLCIEGPARVVRSEAFERDGGQPIEVARFEKGEGNPRCENPAT